MLKNTWILFLLTVFIVGCERQEELAVEKDTVVEQQHTTSLQQFDYAQQISTFVADYTNDYDTSTFVNETSATGKILNESSFTSCIKLNFRKKTPFRDEVGLKYYQQFQMLSMSYKNSKACNEAFDNWIANFGTMAKPIKRMQNLAGIQSSPCYALLNHRQITILFTDCTYENEDWQKTIADLTKSVNNSKYPSVILNVGCAGPVEWKRI